MTAGPSRAGREAARLVRAAAFLTRLPLPDVGWEAAGLPRASRYFALVGAGIGAACAAVWLAAGAVLPPGVAAGLALGAGVLLTGGLHEDGLADCADGLGGGAERARALEIMRDSRVGSFGVLALVLFLGTKWAGLAAMAPVPGALALILAAAAGRAAMVAGAALARPARGTGLGAMMADGPGRGELALAGVTVLILAAAAGWQALPALLAGAAAAGLLLRRATARLGGYTGDVLGASGALAEAGVLIALAGGRG